MGMAMSGKLMIISAPSGTGKTSILKQVMARVRNVAFSVSHTTRTPREGEQEGRDYYFVNRACFLDMVEKGDFLEWAEVHGNYYGTALSPIVAKLEDGHDVILDIDVQGAGIIRREKRLAGAYIFIAPPDLQELEKRLRGRGTEDEETIRRRLENGRHELSMSSEYDYLVVNDVLEDAVVMVSSIIYAERSRGRRAVDGKAVQID